MQAINDLRSILNAAEQAVGRDDVAAAERLLRDALALQESNADSPRDEVAKTLNNLAVVCEMTGKVADAETCYRRAFAIAMASLPASDPFVTTSRENLEEFCKSQGIPFEKRPTSAPRPPAQAPAEPAFAPEPVKTPPPPTPPAASEAPRAAAPVPPAKSPARVAAPVPAPAPDKSRAIIFMVLGVIAFAGVIVAARYWLATGASPEPAATTASPPLASAPAPEPTPPPAPAPEAAVPATPTPEATPAPEPAPTPEPPRTTVPSPSLTVVSAQLCRSLSTSGAWRCEPASGAQSRGTMYYYTRVASGRDTVIEHRWYRNDRLHQRVELRIGANQSGYRTYSRTTVTAERAGNWKVELRSADGRVLHEDTFTVR